MASMLRSLSKALFLGGVYFLIASAWSQDMRGVGAQAPLKVALNANFGLFTNVPDLRFRRDTYEDLLGERQGVPTERYSFLTQNFSLDFCSRTKAATARGFTWP
jgi:hypothetical protein